MKNTLEGQIQIISHAKTIIDSIGLPAPLKVSLKEGLDDVISSVSREKKLEKALEELCYSLSDNEFPQSMIKKAYNKAQEVLKS